MRRPRSAAAVHAFAAVLLVSSCCLGFHAAPRAQERTSQERAPDFYVQTPWDARSVDLAKLYDTVVDTVEKKFFDEALLKRLDWRARANAVRPSVLSAATAEDAVLKINALLAELKTSHTGLFTPDDYDYYALADILGPDNISSCWIRKSIGGIGARSAAPVCRSVAPTRETHLSVAIRPC